MQKEVTGKAKYFKNDACLEQIEIDQCIVWNSTLGLTSIERQIYSSEKRPLECKLSRISAIGQNRFVLIVRTHFTAVLKVEDPSKKAL